MAHEIKNIYINNLIDKSLRETAALYAKGRLIDIGCGTKPYEKIFSPFVTAHIGVDHAQTPHAKDNIDTFGTAYAIPVDDESFDTALCTSVLEHLEEPEAALRECWRVLKPGGIAIYVVPFIWHLHEKPRDFYRFSEYGLQYLFNKTGFETVELKTLSNFWGGFGQLTVYYLYRFNRGPLRWFPVIPFMGLLIQAMSFLAAKLDKSTEWPFFYMLVSKKTNAVESRH